jgi:tripeptide aminopeptidase
MEDATSCLNAIYPNALEIEITQQYRNMREIIQPQKHIIDLAILAMEKAGVKPNIHPIRGGTDGAQLSFKGLPCPNIFTGGLNFHSIYEYIPVQSMEKAVCVIVKIVENLRFINISKNNCNEENSF